MRERLVRQQSVESTFQVQLHAEEEVAILDGPPRTLRNHSDSVLAAAARSVAELPRVLVNLRPTLLLKFKQADPLATFAQGVGEANLAAFLEAEPVTTGLAQGDGVRALDRGRALSTIQTTLEGTAEKGNSRRTEMLNATSGLTPGSACAVRVQLTKAARQNGQRTRNGKTQISKLKNKS
jgi:hypothetical protein